MVDLTKAKTGDKVWFVGGSSAIIDKVKFLKDDADRGAIYDVLFQDGTNAHFTKAGKPASRASYWQDSIYGYMDTRYEMLSVRTPHRTENSLSLSRAFNIASRRPGDDYSRHPALEFQTRNHLRGIAGRYKIPGNYTAPEYEDMTSRKIDEACTAINGGVAVWNFWGVLEKNPPPDFLKESWGKMVELNPQLKAVKFDETNAEEMYNAHLGVTSGFNVDDINFFMEQKKVGEGLPAKQAHEMPVHGARMDRIDAMAATHMQWVASPKTAIKIEERLIRQKKKALKNG